MDVGAITKGRGKGKSKQKYESHGDGGKGKKGKKGKQAKNSGKSKGHEHFDGHCLFCGIWGHQQKDCWFRKRKGHQVNHVSQDGQAASCSAHQKTSSSSASEFPQTASTHGAIVYCGLEEDEDGWVFGVEGQEGAISDHFVGANAFSDRQPLKHYGQKKVELLSDSGEKMRVTFSVHDVKRAIISTSATAPSGIETHLDEWDPQRGRTVSYLKKRTSGGTRWLNIMARGGLFFSRHCGLRTATADRRVPDQSRV